MVDKPQKINFASLPAQAMVEAEKQQQALLRAKGLERNKDEIVRLKLAAPIPPENEIKYEKRLKDHKIKRSPGAGAKN